jgi:hypothetical protein
MKKKLTKPQGIAGLLRENKKLRARNELLEAWREAVIAVAAARKECGKLLGKGKR